MASASTTSLLAFGPLLKRSRRAARLTQAELAERAGFSVVYISMLERGARQPQRTTVALLADALDLTAQERIAWEGAAQLDATAASDRRRSRDGTSPPSIGAFLGALPAGPLVGREAEQEAIRGALQAVARGQGRLLFLVGEPGVGKTRLAQEITVLAHVLGFRVLTGRCYEPQQTVAYYPFLEALAMAEAGADAAVQEKLAKSWPEVARLLPDRVREGAHDRLTNAPSSLDNRNAQQRLFYQVRNFLGTLADRQPLALLLDDLHWADGASVDLLQHLARHTRDLPILLVGTARAVEAQREHPLVDALSDLRHDELMERIEVDRLEKEETSALVGATLGGADGAQGDENSVSAILSQCIYARSEGNAFFIRQLTRVLQEQGELTFANGRWELSAQDTAVTVPESIRSVIGQRLGRLTTHTQEVLREASVLGQVFAFEDLRRLGGRGEQEVEEALEEAVAAGIVREGEQDRYGLDHALTRDTLYADLSARRKRRLHRAAADAIEQSTDHERRAAELSYHLLAADEGERALPYALLAGDQAEAVYAHAEAERHYRAALAVAQELGDHAREAQALEMLGAVVGALGRNTEAIELLEQALRAYKATQDQDGELHALTALLEIQSMYGREMADVATARAQAILARIEPANESTLTAARASALAVVYRGLAMVDLGAGRYDEQLTAARRAADLARAAGDEAQLAWALHRLHIVSAPFNEEPVVRAQILAMAERTGQTILVIWSHNMLGFWHANAGEFTLAMAHMEQSLAVAERRQDPIRLAWQLANFVEFLLVFGDWPRMRACAARAEAIMREVDPRGATFLAVGVSMAPALCALVDGREEEGRRLLEQTIARMTQVGNIRLLQFPTCFLAESDLLAGHIEQAQLRLTSFLQTADPAAAKNEAPSPLPLLIWAEAALGQMDQAEARLQALLATVAPLNRADALRAQGLLATMQERWEMAAEALDEALDRSRAMPYPYAEAKALWAYGRLETARRNPTEARKRFKQALAICDRLGEGLYRKYIDHDLRRLPHQA